MTRLTNLQSDNYYSTQDNVISIDIKFGNKVYHISPFNIAYIYKTEGVFFIVDKTSLKLPLDIKSLSQLPIDLDESLYFQINSDTIFCKEDFTVTEITTESIEIVSKNKYKDTFKIPNELINQFQIWFETN